jgi:Flp pilus assembly protein TadG
VVDFVLISILLVSLFLALVQLCIILYVRNVLVSSAAEGARYGANVNLTAADAKTKTEAVIAREITGNITSAVTSSEAGGLVQVDVSAPIPLFGLFAPAHSVTLRVTGHAVAEGR